MKEVFKKRRQTFQTQSLKYLRYVFNDHFTLFLMILLGAFIVQYSQFLQAHRLNLPEKLLLVLIVSVISLIPGRLATFLEAADRVFLLVKEKEILKLFQASLRRSLILPGIVGLVLIAVAWPMLGWPVWALVIWWLILLGLKAAMFIWRLRQWDSQQVLDWSRAIAYEENRRVAILRFFALFTNVKGLKSHSHRRKYLDFLLPKTGSAYEFMFWRSFLRSGEYLGLTLRLLLLAALALIFVKSSLVAVILVCVLNALLIFQLLALQNAMDYQLLTRIYPLARTEKLAAVKKILTRVMLVLSLIQLILGGIFLVDKLYLLGIVVINGLLIALYLPRRLKN